MAGAVLTGLGFACLHGIRSGAEPLQPVAQAAAPKTIAVAHTAAPRQERLIRVGKGSRLAPWSDSVKPALSAELLKGLGEKRRDASLAKAELAFAALPKPVAPPVETASAPVEVAEAGTVDVDVARPATVIAQETPDRIIVPSKEQVAAAEGPALMALAAVPQLRQTASLEAPVETALARPVPAPRTAEEAKAEPAESDPFGLVLADPADGTVPLPIARPAGTARKPAASEPVLAYADPQEEIEDMPRLAKPTIARVGNGVAVYDITAGTVYLPSGERLEAHSGLGKMRDNPRFAHQKMRGPTPPHTYDLTMREALFHGVEAIRLNPIGGAGAIHNRVGLLAHTYMLGARGDSNGCVSIKDYKRFLAAFKRGEIKRLVVVERMAGSPARENRPTLASLFSRS